MFFLTFLEENEVVVMIKILFFGYFFMYSVTSSLDQLLTRHHRVLHKLLHNHGTTNITTSTF